jgi:hypothetical protein
MKAGEPGEDGKTKPDVEYDIAQMGGLSQAVTYLLDWSAKDPSGKPIMIAGKSADDVANALLALPQEAYKEITDAIDEHVKKVEAERQERKNGLGIVSESNPISSSANG